MTDSPKPSTPEEIAEARQLLAAEYETGGLEGPYPIYAALARTGKGDFTLCSIRAVARALQKSAERLAALSSPEEIVPPCDYDQCRYDEWATKYAALAERLAECERQLTQADAALNDGRTFDGRAEMANANDYWKWVGEAWKRHASRHPKEPEP